MNAAVLIVREERKLRIFDGRDRGRGFSLRGERNTRMEKSA